MKITAKTVKTAAVIVAVVIAGLFLRKKLKQWGLLDGSKEGNKSELYELLEEDTSEEVQGRATISKTEARQYAAQIKGAWGVFNDDEEKIYEVFNRVRNLADILMIIDAYGIYQPNSLLKGADLVTDLRKRLNKSEIKKINDIIMSKGINYQI